MVLNSKEKTQCMSGCEDTDALKLGLDVCLKMRWCNLLPFTVLVPAVGGPVGRRIARFPTSRQIIRPVKICSWTSVALHSNLTAAKINAISSLLQSSKRPRQPYTTVCDQRFLHGIKNWIDKIFVSNVSD